MTNKIIDDFWNRTAECSICLEEMVIMKTECASYFDCTHYFHYKCITNYWLIKRADITCPNCNAIARKSFKKEDIFNVEWIEIFSNKDIVAVPINCNKNINCFFIGPYPCRGNVDYSHSSYNNIGINILDEKDKEELLALYEYMPVGQFGLSRKITRVGNKLFNKGEIIELN
jgi:Ring finger domain